MNLPADGTTVNNTDGITSTNNNNTNNVVNKVAPKVIAPIRLPGVLPRGDNEVPIPEEAPIENVVDEGDDKSTPTTETVSTTENENETVDDNEDGDYKDDSDKVETELEDKKTTTKQIKVLGKVFNTIEAAEIYVNKQLAIARGAQSATAKQTSELKARLEALEQALGNNKPEVNVDPNVQEFWDDVRKAEAHIETVKDPAEKARLRAILTGAIVKNEVDQVEARLQKMFEDKVGPIENERKALVEREEVKSKAKAVFAQVADLVDDVTNLPSYPELQNSEDLGEIASMWLQFKESGQVGDKILYHPDFVMTLTHSYRDLKKSNSANTKTNNENGKAPAVIKKKAAPSSHNLPPNFTKGNGGIGFTIPGVIGRR